MDIGRTYHRVRIALWLSVSRTIDELRLIRDDLSVLVFADNSTLGCNIHFSRECVVPLDEVCNGSGCGGNIPLVLCVIPLAMPPIRRLHLVFEVWVHSQIQGVELVRLILGQEFPVLPKGVFSISPYGTHSEDGLTSGPSQVNVTVWMFPSSSFLTDHSKYSS